MGGFPNRDPLDRDPLDRDPLDRDPWTETPPKQRPLARGQTPVLGSGAVTSVKQNVE